jgi:hypothetical protein
MGNFHRFVDPTYNLLGTDSFPGSIGPNDSYDRVNVTSGGVGGPGGAANAGPQKGSGVNSGTYFVAFGEDGTSQNANRGFRALSENTDAIDEILRRNVPKWTKVTLSNPSATSVVLPGDVFVGDDASTDAWELAAISTTQNYKLLNGLTPITLIDIDDGTPSSSVIGQGWYPNPTLRFSSVVNEDIFVAYGARSSTARIVEQEREAVWRGLMNDAFFGIDGRSLSWHGLDERYRRNSLPTTASPALSTPGSGARITRDGQAIEAFSPVLDYKANPYPDPFLACWMANAGYATQVAKSAAHTGSDFMGNIGFLTISPLKQVPNDPSSGEFASTNRFLAGVMNMVPMDTRADLINSVATRTRVPAGAAATTNPSGSDPNLIKITAPNYFKSGGFTAMATGMDYIVVDFGGGVKKGYVLATINADDEIKVKAPGDEFTDPGLPTNTPVNIEWFQVLSGFGMGRDNFLGKHGGVFFMSPRPLTAATPDDSEWVPHPSFIAIEDAGGGSPVSNAASCFQWGYWSPISGGTVNSGKALWDGHLEVTSHIPNKLSSYPQTTGGQSSNPSASITISPGTPGADFSGIASSGVDQQLDIDINTSLALFEDGQDVEIIIMNLNGSNMDLVWDDIFYFSGSLDHKIPEGARGIYKFEGRVGTLFGTQKIFMSRTDYPEFP